MEAKKTAGTWAAYRYNQANPLINDLSICFYRPVSSCSYIMF